MVNTQSKQIIEKIKTQIKSMKTMGAYANQRKLLHVTLKSCLAYDNTKKNKKKTLSYLAYNNTKIKKTSKISLRDN